MLGAGLAGLAGSSALVAGCDAEEQPPEPTTAPADAPFDPLDWDSVRAQFPLDPTLAQLAAFVLSPHTRPLEEAIAGHRERLGVDTETALFEGLRLEDEVRTAAAAYAGGVAGQYALTESTTMGIASMYGGLALRPDDEVLTTTHDFFATEESLRLLRLRTGARVNMVPVYDDPEAATIDEITARLAAAATPRTRVVAVTWVHSSTGVRLPIPEIREAVGPDVVLCVDGVHGFAAVDTDLDQLGCDYLAAGTHKWLFGPRGTGILWARDWTPLTEIIPSFSGPQDGGRLTPGGYHTFEHRWALADAFAFQQSIGRDRAVERTTSQATQLKEGLAAIDGIRVVTPLDPELSAGIVCLDVPGLLPYNAVLELRERGIVASATPYDTSYLRLGPSIVTTPEQVAETVAAVAELA
ncbi:MAG: aminotransferase class V-fold PLP-dependent enzyme [Nocardioides sp.]